MEELLDTERELLAKVAETEGWAEGYTVTRVSPRAYDLLIAGRFGESGTTTFKAWLPLAAIHAVDWPLPAIWELSDAYGAAPPPEMERDWSGIRDSSDDVRWEMFEIARRKLMVKIVDCACGRKVELLDTWYTVCDGCGQGYNGSGQQLAPPSQWGEETGEQFDDAGEYMGQR